MIKNLEIKNFKSIKHLKLDCKRINLFIGEPNTGKSNILETLGILSHVYYGNIKDFVRFETMSNLFYDESLDDTIDLKFDENIILIDFTEGMFRGVDNLEILVGGDRTERLAFDYDYRGSGGHNPHDEYKFLKFYKFKVKRSFPRQESDFLLPPFADNLLAIVLTRKEIKRLVKQIFDAYGLRVVLKPQENQIEVQKEIEDVIISYPYSLVSDTLQRIIFYLVAMETNENSVLVFEEPEAHAFPYYTKILAERIALDKANNQYFIATHNPYLLLSILEKAHKDDVAIFITYFEDYQTKVKQLSEKELTEIMDLGIDLFFNIERFIEVKE
ncbi:MAG: AAA family ATPase [Methanomicrobia archaeon]|nr:AAA family ATPase [Methanomicrobia archaeon]